MRKTLSAIIIIFLGLGQVWGDSFTSDGTTRLYFENNQISGLSNARWVVDGGTAWIQVANSSSIADNGGTISAACVHVDSYKYYIVVPEGTWSHFRLYRGTTPSKDSRWNSTATIAFDGNEHNFLTSYASADGWADATWSSIETITIYTIPDSLHTYANEYESRSYTWETDGSDLYANIQLGDTYWNKIAMENTGRTYNGKAIYSCSFIALYGGVKQIQFQLYNGETYKGEYKYTPDGSWAANNVFADKTYVGYSNETHTWINFITYELDGGTKFFADTQTSYNIESPTITLHAAAKSGYVFAGWYDNSSFTGDVITSIPTGSYGDKTLYAKWESTTCIGEHSAGTAFHMIMDTNSDETPTDVDLSAGQYADLSSYATFNGNRGTAVYGTTSSAAKILKGGAKERRRLQMSSTTHVVTLNLSCPLVAYDTIIIYDTHATSTGKTYEFSITSSPTYSGTNSTSGATVSKTADTTRYVVPVGSGLIGVTPIYVWGSASSDLRIRRIEIRRTNTWQLTYHGNGTSGLTPTNVPAVEYRPASPVALSSTVPVLGDYTFAGWNTATDGSGTNYASGDDYTIPSATTTLYAKWTLAVTLDDNGGSGGSTSVTMTHKSATHSAITLPTRTGYEFVGYYDAASGGRRVTDETGALLASVGSYTSSDRTWKYGTSGLTLYAHWKFVIYHTGDKVDESQIESFAGGSTIDWPIEYRMKVNALDQWYSLYLPFDVDSVCVWDTDDSKYYKIEPYYRPEVGDALIGGHYLIRTPVTATDLSLANFGDWRDPTTNDWVPSKNTPYIIQWHLAYFSTNNYVSFFGHTNAEIPDAMTSRAAPSSDNVVNVYGNDAMVEGSVTGAYLLEGDYGSYGAWLRDENPDASRTILPFECYIVAKSTTRAKYRVLRRGMSIEETATGWEDVINSERKTCVEVYTITGYRLTQYNDCSFSETAQRLNAEYGAGMYILRAGNESVKLMLEGGK